MGEKKLSKQESYRRILATWEQMIREYQDTLFSRLYSDPERVLDLYLTLHPEEKGRGVTQDQIEIITLKNSFLVRRYNDVAFQVGDRLIVLVEHQSTINKNMPLRMLFYVAREYEQVISSIREKLYKENMIRIPRPEFYIVYTGGRTWHQKELKLSDAYRMVSKEDIPLELKVQVLCEEEWKTTQNTLGSYYDFIAFVKENKIDGKISTEAFEDYRHNYRGSELFKKFLERLNVEEVIKMENYEFDMEVALKVWAEEAKEEGKIQMIIEMGREDGLDNASILKRMQDKIGLSLEQATAYLEQYGKQMV